MDNPWTSVAFLGPAAFIAVALLVPVVRRAAIRFGIIDHPSVRKSHREPTPYLGGVAIAAVVVVASSLVPYWGRQGAVVVGAAAAVGLTGLVDDIRTLPPWPRIAVEVLAALLVVAAGGVRGVPLLGPAGGVIAVAWLVLLTNSFNLLDNMDGCAAAVGAATAVCILAAAALQGQFLVAGLAAVLAGACVGFLVHNHHPARIFMGDAGSLFLGFLLAAMMLRLKLPADRLSAGVTVLLLGGVAVLDTVLVVVSRISAGVPVCKGGTDHLSHRMVKLGVPTSAVPLALAAGTVLIGSVGVMVGHGLAPPAAAGSLAALVGAVALASFLRVPYEERPADPAESDRAR